jgi:large subunit ribosomal protein L2
MKINNLSLGLKLRAGRSRVGKILVRGRWSAVKKLYRFVDFSYELNYYFCSKVISFLKDSFRGHLMLIMYLNGIMSYRLPIDGLKIGSILYTSNYDLFLKQVNDGMVIVLKDLREGCFVNQLNSTTGLFGQLLRSPGIAGQLLKIDMLNKIVMIKLASSKRLILYYDLFCVVGVIANKKSRDDIVGSAGLNILRGRRPIVRGIAMNPVDHPNGGRTPGGKVYRSLYNNIARSSKRTATVRNKFLLHRENVLI